MELLGCQVKNEYVSLTPHHSNRPPAPKSRQEQDTDPGYWVACHHPEKPADDYTCYHDCCSKCLLAMMARYTVTGSMVRIIDTGEDVLDIMRSRLEEFGEAPP